MVSHKPTILITGCSSGGIGAAVAVEYQSRGYQVIATARNISKISSELKSLPEVSVVAVDITSQKSIDDAVSDVSGLTGGKLDILFNNAGSSLTFPALDTPIETARLMFELHIMGPLAVTKAFTPLLVQGTNACVINNASIAGETNLPFQCKRSIPVSEDKANRHQRYMELRRLQRSISARRFAWSLSHWVSES